MSTIFSRNTLRTFAILLSGFCAAACGGGGSSGGVPAPLPVSPSGQASNAAPAPVPLVPSPSTQPSSPADATQARFRGPEGIALAANGDLFVADTQNFTIRKIAASGVVTTLAGAAGKSGNADGIGNAARFTEPRSVALDSAGNVFVADGSTIRKVTPSGEVTTIAGVQGQFGDIDGAGNQARFHAPTGIAVDRAGNVYVADPADTALRIRKVSAAGVVSTFAGGNSGASTTLPHDGAGTLAAFVGPRAITVDTSGNLYVADVAMGGLTAPNFYDGSTFIRKVSPEGIVTTIAGNYGFGRLPAGGPVADISQSTAIAVDSGGGNLFVTDRFNAGNRIRKIAPSGEISTIPLDASQFLQLAGLALAPGGDLYASDQGNHTIVKVSQDGTTTIYAGKPGEPGAADTP